MAGVSAALLLALAGTTPAVATPAPAATTGVGAAMIEASRPASIVAALPGAGYKAVLSKDNAGDPMITSAASGATFTVYFYGCEKNADCRSLQLYASYTVKAKPPLDKINAWNLNNRFATALLDKGGDPALQTDIVTDGGGMTEALFGQIVDRCAGAMGAFQTHIDW